LNDPLVLGGATPHRMLKSLVENLTKTGLDKFKIIQYSLIVPFRIVKHI
jgi:hypothetical protein